MDIPEDVMKAARLVVARGPTSYAIANAILAERDSMRMAVEVLRNTRADTLTGFGQGYALACDDFLDAIRTPPTGEEQ